MRLNLVAGDVAIMPPGVPARELAGQPVGILRGVDGNGGTPLATALDVETVRDLALWPPYHAAKAILAAAFFPEQTDGFDAEAPADLLPRAGVYPTERLFFKKLLIDTVPEAGNQALPVEEAGPIDLVAALAAPAGFGRLATGALLTFSQSWFAEGVTLGQLLHSTSLAPGESTRIAVIDWSRRTRAATSEEISESEMLSNTMGHSRAISEVTSATASEFQSGTSHVTSDSTTAQVGVGMGIEFGMVSIGTSSAVSTTNTEALSVSSSFGARDLAASYAQEINDRSQQNASSVRNRRASSVREVSQTEHESISTRQLTNYNHMHALSLHYYEVVQAFRTTTQLERAERCLFLPAKLVDFRDPATVDRWRLVLAGVALGDRVRRQLTVEYGVVEIAPETPRITLGGLVAAGLVDLRATVGVSARLDGTGAAAPAPVDTGTPSASPAPAPAPAPVRVATDYRRAPVESAAALLVRKGWNLEQLNRIGWATGGAAMRRGSDSVFVSDDALLVGCSLREGQAARFVVRRRDGSELELAESAGGGFAFAEPVAITDIASIGVQYAGAGDFQTSLVLQINLSGTVMPLDVPVVLRPMSVPATVVKFGGVLAARELTDHLAANQLHYTQAILRSLDSATVAALLARYTYRGLPLGMLVDPQPFAVSANFLVFRMNVASGAEPDHARWVEEEREWQQWLERRGLAHPAPKSEVIPLPSGGLFAEAVLGRSNAAEKVDLTRFWNWQDSPIPITAPEIAPITAGSRATSEDLVPGRLSSPVLSIQAPTALPDPAGIAAIVAAIQNGNMFRDMSGLAQTAAVAQAAQQASAQGANAGQNLATSMAAHTARMRIVADLVASIYGAKSSGGSKGGGAGERPAANATEEGGRLNFARELDERGGAGGVNGASAPGGTGTNGSGGPVESSSEFAAAGDGGVGAPAPTTEETLFDRLTGGPAADLAGQLVAASTGDDAGASGPTAAARPGQQRRRQPQKSPAPRDVTFEFRFFADESVLPPTMRALLRSDSRLVEDAWTHRLLAKGRLLLDITSIEGDVLEDWEENLQAGFWISLPDAPQYLRFHRRTASRHFFLLAYFLPEPLEFPPTVSEAPIGGPMPNDARTGPGITTEVFPENPETHPLEIDVTILLVYHAIIVLVVSPNSLESVMFDSELSNLQLTRKDVVYKSLPRPTVANGQAALLYDVVVWGRAITIAEVKHPARRSAQELR